MTWGKVGAASAVLAGAALSGAWAPGAGMRDVEAAANSFVVCAGRVITSSWRGEWDIADGIIVVRDGRIEAVGSADDVDVPLGLPVYHYPDATVMPGMVAACSNVVGQRSGDESIGAGYSALDAFNVYGDYRGILAGGVTTVHIDPGWYRLVSGQGAVVKLGGEPGSRVLQSPSDMTFNLGPRAYLPPDIVEEVYPSSGAEPIEPGVPQRPDSRIGQYLALREALDSSVIGTGEFNVHLRDLSAWWQAGGTARVQVNDAADIAGAIQFFSSNLMGSPVSRSRSNSNGVKPYLVGCREIGDVLDLVSDANMGFVYTLPSPLGQPGGNLGNNPEARDADITVLSGLFEAADEGRVSLSTGSGASPSGLRLAAATALRAGLTERQIVNAITSVPARQLGLGGRVGTIAPGADADFVVLSGAPLSIETHVLKTFVNGVEAYSIDQDDEWGEALVVRAGTIWLGPNNWLHDGAVLIEDGKIVSVGQRVPTPPNARVIDAGPDAFVTPGLIDAYGHLGLAGDQSAIPPNLPLERLVGYPDVSAGRVARSGVTTVLTGPYRFDNNGSRIAAIKTWGGSREARVVNGTAAIAFDVRGGNPRSLANRIKQRLEAGKKYVEKWKKYEEELKEWEKKKAEGKLEGDAKPKTEEIVEETAKEDPITGRWSMRIFGGPMPNEEEGEIALKLTGSSIEGRVTEPYVPIEHKIIGTLDGTHITGTIEVDTGGMGTPTWEAELQGEDFMSGTAGIEGLATVNFEATRTSKEAVEFKVSKRKRRTTGKDGRPLPPKVDESLEPIRALLNKQIPALVAVSSADEIDALLKLISEYELGVVLLGAEGARDRTDLLKEKQVGVVLPTRVLRQDDWEWYHQGDDLSRRGIPVAFQSNAEDGARTLPEMALYAVSRGMSPESALAAFSVDAARMFKLDDRIGSIAPGREGDLVIFSGYPFEAQTVVERVIVGGKEIQP
ncbi:MAG: amidohydrolase family protein [Planctomycetes bacterium]|nr:amidohydrolase family protein [Planctomycetota bacterium]